MERTVKNDAFRVQVPASMAITKPGSIPGSTAKFEVMKPSEIICGRLFLIMSAVEILTLIIIILCH